MTKPMKTEHLPSGAHGKPVVVVDPALPVVVEPKPTKAPKEKRMTHPDHPKHVPLTPEELAAGKTPNSGKLHKDGSPVPGQDAAHDAERAAERAAEAAGEVEVPEVPTDPVVDPVPPEPTPAPAP